MGSLGPPLRQKSALTGITRQLASMPEVLGALLVGSMAAGYADAASDLDLIVCAQPSRFDELWLRRHDLHVTGAPVWWDNDPAGGLDIGLHRWVTDDLVLVEALITAPGAGVRLARPWQVIAGGARLAELFEPRGPIDRAEFDPAGAHPVDQAFEELKVTLRRYAHDG